MNNWQNIQAFIDTRPRRWLACSIAGIAIYLLLGVFWGFDVCDNGQYMTFYANIFTAPETVGYHFMYYLSGIVGGTFLAICPAMGLLGMRLLGLACLVLCMFTVWRILKPHISATAIVVGNTLSMVAFVALPVTFCYDLLSIALYLLAIEQLLKPRMLTALVGGCLLGINAFSRTPNVLGFIFAFIPLLAVWCGGKSLKKGAQLAAVSIAGIAVGVGGIIVLMAALGHLTIFTDNLATLRHIAADNSGESSHNIVSLITQQFSFYYIEFTTWFKLASIIGIYTVLRQRICSPFIRVMLLLGALSVSVWLMWRMLPLQPIWALCAIGCVTAIWLNCGNMRSVAVVALLLMLILPMGSDSGFNNGSIILMLASPIAIAVCMEHTRMFRTGYFTVAFAIVCMGKMITGGAYFDGGPLWQKTATINSPHVTGVFTTPERAAIVNDALKGIQPWVKPGDTLFVYGSMPMLNYLTDTRPAMDCCWPELLSTSLLNNRLEKYNGHLPFILRQKFLSMGSTFSEPTDSLLTTYGRHADNNMFYFDTKIAALNDFLTENHYQKVFENTHFVLYTPQKNAKKTDLHTVAK